MPILLDLTPLRVSPAYRRLFTGFTLAGVGSQLTVVAIGLQVDHLTGSSLAVGLVGLFALVPIIILGLYGGALIDAHHRRKVALVASAVMWASGILTALQAWLGNTHPLVLYLLVAVNSAGFAVVSLARSGHLPTAARTPPPAGGQRARRLRLQRRSHARTAARRLPGRRRRLPACLLGRCGPLRCAVASAAVALRPASRGLADGT